MPRSPGRTGHRWRQARAHILATQDTCAWCGNPVDKTLSGRHPWGPSIDHTTPLSQGGDPLDPTNLQLMHLRCNSQKNNGRQRTRKPRNSRNW